MLVRGENNPQMNGDGTVLLHEKHRKKEWKKGEVLTKVLRSEMTTTVSRFIIPSLTYKSLTQQYVLT